MGLAMSFCRNLLLLAGCIFSFQSSLHGQTLNSSNTGVYYTEGGKFIKSVEINGDLEILDLGTLSTKGTQLEGGKSSSIACSPVKYWKCLILIKKNNLIHLGLIVKFTDKWSVASINKTEIESADDRILSDAALSGAKSLFLKEGFSSGRARLLELAIGEEGGGTLRSIRDYDSRQERFQFVPTYDGDLFQGFAYRTGPYDAMKEHFPTEWIGLGGNAPKPLVVTAPPPCIPWIVVGRTIVCRAGSKSGSHFSTHREAASGLDVIVVSPPSNGDVNDAKYLGSDDTIWPVSGAVVFTGFEDGSARPYSLNLATSEVRPMLRAECNPTAGQVTNYVIGGVTSRRDGALVTVSGPLLPTRRFVVPIANGIFTTCPQNARELPRVEGPDAPLAATAQRLRTASRHVPYVLVKPNVTGPATGRAVVFVYGAAGIWQSEGGLSTWRRHWLAAGGSVVIAHVRGGGGYGLDWVRRGYGVTGKMEAVRDLIEIGEELKTTGIVKYGSGIIAGSAGGVVGSLAAISRPDLFPIAVLRAPCFSFYPLIPAKRYDCSLTNEFGNPDDPTDAAAMLKLSPRDVAMAANDTPNFVFLVPQVDSHISLKNLTDYGMVGVSADRRCRIDLPGVDHTDLLPSQKEDDLTARLVRILLSSAPVPNSLNKYEIPKASSLC